MTIKFLRLPEVIEETGKGKSSIYKDIAEGTFPAPIKIGPRASGWIDSEVEDWKKEQIKKSRGPHDLDFSCSRVYS